MKGGTVLTLAALVGSATACTNDLLPQGRKLHAHVAGEIEDNDIVEPPEFHAESRAAPDWSYKPNYAYERGSPGCCGVEDAAHPGREPCGPEFWRYISEDTLHHCVATGTTNQQSPINFITEGDHKLNFTDMLELVSLHPEWAVPRFSETRCSGTVDIKDNTWEVDFGDDCRLHVDLLGERWHLVNFHFHNAEHSISGVFMPLEVHMVHKSAAGNYLVLGVFLAPGKENAFFKRLENTPGNGGMSLATQSVSPYDVVPEDMEYWHYRGSLTTPPCQVADGAHVEWFVFRRPVQMSMNQLGFFGSYFEDLPKAYNNQVNRPTQKLLPTTTVYLYHSANRAFRSNDIAWYYDDDVLQKVDARDIGDAKGKRTAGAKKALRAART